MLVRRLCSLASASGGHRSRLQWHLAIATRESALAPCGLGALDQGTNVKGEDVALGFARRFWNLAKSTSRLSSCRSERRRRKAEVPSAVDSCRYVCWGLLSGWEAFVVFVGVGLQRHSVEARWDT